MIQPIDPHSVHRITSGQVVVDLQTAVKELVENSLDAGATSIDVRFQHHGLKSIEVVDNGSGIAPGDHDHVALKHYTSKLAAFEDLARVLTFGFRGEALSSLCALADGLTVTTATSSDAPMGTAIELDRSGAVRSKSKVARQRGTTVTVSNLFRPLPVRRKEFERNAKREFQKALTLLHAYALVPCALENKGVRLTVSHQTEGGRKTIVFKTEGSPSIRASVTAVWGPKALDNIVDLDLSFDVESEKSILRRAPPETDAQAARLTPVKLQGLISKFAVGAGRTSADRQFFFVNGRPYNPGKVQKAINEVYRTFSVNQSPFVIANIILPTNACDINISPDKRTIFLHSENNLVEALKAALEAAFSSARSTYDVNSTQPAHTHTQVPQQNTQQTKNQEKSLMLTQKHSGGEKQTQQSSSANQPLHQPTPISAAVPHLLTEDDDQSEHEPEPTFVAQPGSTEKVAALGTPRDRTADRTRSRTPSEPLFFPQSDDEQGNDAPRTVDVGKKRHRVPSASSDEQPCPVQAPRKDNATSSTTYIVPPVHKPRSFQTVLNTRGAAWNSRENNDEGGRERKRAKLSSDESRVRTNRKSFRSSLSQFMSGGKKPDNTREEESGDESEEEDELAEDKEEPAKHSSKGKTKPRPQVRSHSPQGTIVLSDDEHVMDVDKSSSTSAQPAGAASSSIPQTSARPNEAEDSWEFSSTLVGTYMPSAGKVVEPPPATAAPSLRKSDTESVTLRVDLINIGTHYLDMYNRLSSSPPSLALPSASPPSSTLRSAVSSANLDTAAEDAVASAALSRIISKSDFEQMEIIGQFNLGFILVRKRGGPASSTGASSATETNWMDDLFIVDQHAADEKWNFETLQETTVIASQKLFRPRELHFTAADEMLAIENMDVLKRNGFELEQVQEREITFVGDDEDRGEEASEMEGGRVRLRLVAQPMSKDTVFDIKDLEELIHLMQDRPTGTMVRCSKARAMFAMRACRRSVMVGKALDRPRMTAIVRHMGTMDQPWNCPHGRPTMRHLSDLKSFGGYVPPLGRRPEIEWGAFGGGAGIDGDDEGDEETCA